MGYNSVADIIGLSSFVYPWLPPKVDKSLEIPKNFMSSLSLLTTYFQLKLKIAEFSHSPFFDAPFGRNPLEFGVEIWRQKTRIMGLPDGEEIMTLAFFVLTQYRRVTDGQTDRQTDGQIAITRASIVSRG